MKIPATIICIFITFLSYGQDINNFKITDGSIIWQKVYTCELTPEEVCQQLKQSRRVKNIEFSDNTIIGEIIDMEPNIKGAGFRRGATPIFLLASNIVAAVVVNFKDGRYRAEVKNISFKTNTELPISKIGELTSIEAYCLKKRNTEFNGTFLNPTAPILNYTFNKLFEIKETDDNW